MDIATFFGVLTGFGLVISALPMTTAATLATERSAVADGTTVYQQRLPNGKIVTREKKYSGKSIRQRRKHQTKTIPAKPFIAPALEQGRAEAVQAMNAKLAEDLKKVGRP